MDATTRLLVISGDFSLYEAVKKASLTRFSGLFFCQAEDDILSVIKENGIRVVLLDMGGEPREALALLKKLKKFDPLLDILLAGSPRDSEEIMGWINQGATDYLPKPFEERAIRESLERILDKRELRRETFRLEKKLERKYVFQEMVSRNPYMQEIFALIESIAKHFTGVLITGETGTGKEMVARAIHALSPSREKNLVICDCASIPENLFESELFGYRRGAFTGADRDKKGLFEEASGGIIFLDEIAEIPPAVQAKLLRVLENHQFRPLGGNETISVDVRVIAATNRDLAALVKNGGFREDLFHRLNRVEIHLPPLRDRLDDIPLLVRHFLEGYNKTFAKGLKGVSRDVQKIFLRYEWPGNIRELENVLESSAMLGKKEFIDVLGLPKYLRDIAPVPGRIPFIRRDQLSTLDELEKEYILYLLKITKRNLQQTARTLGISRTTLYNKLRKYKIPA